MGLKVIEIDRNSDLLDISRVERDAFDIPYCALMNLYFPCLSTSPIDREAAIKEAADRQVEWYQGDPTSTWIKVVDDGTNEVLGAALWNIYHENPCAEEQSEEATWFAKGEDRDVGNELLEQFLGPRTTFMQMPHVFLHLCFTAPNGRRRGVGRLLMQWGTEKADELGYGSYLDATVTGRNLYKEYDFVDEKAHELSTAKFPRTARLEELERWLVPYTWWPMYRPVGGKYTAGITKLPWDQKQEPQS